MGRKSTGTVRVLRNDKGEPQWHAKWTRADGTRSEWVALSAKIAIDGNAGAGARHGLDGGDPAQGAAGDRAPAMLGPEGNGDDARGASAEVAPRLRGLAPVAGGVGGGDDRAVRGGVGHAHPRELPAPRGWIPQVHGPHPDEQEVRRRPRRRGMSPRARDRIAKPQERRDDPQAGVGKRSSARTERGAAAHAAPRERPRK